LIVWSRRGALDGRAAIHRCATAWKRNGGRELFVPTWNIGNGRKKTTASWKHLT